MYSEKHAAYGDYMWRKKGITANVSASDPARRSSYESSPEKIFFFTVSQYAIRSHEKTCLIVD